MKYWEYCHSPLGEILVIAENGLITDIRFADEVKEVRPNELTAEAVRQLSHYFAGTRKQFDLPLAINGTLFQQRVYNAVMKVPYGSTVSYRDLTIMAGNRRGFQATGQAVRRNRLLIVVPCHRVIRNDGSLGGYGGREDRKKYLLELEGGYRL